MKIACNLILLLVCVVFSGPVLAQETVTVPDVTGLKVPQASAELNRVGLRLGNQNTTGWNLASGLAPDTISLQSVAAGTAAATGTIVDVTVLRSANLALVYDDNDLTAVNLSAETLNLSGVSFNTVGGPAAAFLAARWAGTLEAGDCGQLWSVNRNGPKEVTGCNSTHWLTTTNPQEHFWTAANGVVRFQIMDNGLERMVCDAAPVGSQDQPLRCEAYIAGSGTSGEVTPYVYFAYTTQAFALINPSADKWMPTDETTILNYNPQIMVPGASVRLGDPSLFGNPATAADLTQLAPHQCLLLTSDNPNAVPPESCDVIAQLDVTSTVAFWLADFQIDSAADDERRQCPAAVADKTTICVMPR